MPRFDNEGFNPNKRIDNDSRDRSVPEDENYYGSGGFDINAFSSGAEVKDNQGYAEEYREYGSRGESLSAPSRSVRQSVQGFEPEVKHDYDEDRRRLNERRAARQKAAQKKQRAKKRAKRRAVFAIILIIILLPAVMAVSVLGKINYDDQSENRFVSASELKSDAAVKNILLLGVDAREDEDSETSRADTMMLISVDTLHHCIKMTSFLRDTWVYIPSYDGKQRLNASSTYDGYSGVVDTIEYNFGIDIDGYVVADFQMFEVLVDSIGGVKVDVTEEEASEVTNHPGRYGDVILESGEHTLTGEQALAYCRIRKIDTDFMRTQRQRTVMTSILSAAKRGGPLRLYKMAASSAPYIETNLSKAQLIRIASMAVSCLGGDMPQQKVPFEGTWEYANIGGASVIAINVDKNKEMLIDYIYNKSADELEKTE